MYAGYEHITTVSKAAPNIGNATQKETCRAGLGGLVCTAPEQRYAGYEHVTPVSKAELNINSMLGANATHRKLAEQA